MDLATSGLYRRALMKPTEPTYELWIGVGEGLYLIDPRNDPLPIISTGNPPLGKAANDNDRRCEPEAD